jgi:hypothetical protein
MEDMRRAHKILAVKSDKKKSFGRCRRRVEGIIILNILGLKVLTGSSWLRIESNGDLL